MIRGRLAVPDRGRPGHQETGPPWDVCEPAEEPVDWPAFQENGMNEWPAGELVNVALPEPPNGPCENGPRFEVPGMPGFDWLGPPV